MIERLAEIKARGLLLEAIASREPKEKSPSKEWWFRAHPLILNKTPTIMGEGVEPQLIPLLTAAKNDLYLRLAEKYDTNGCPTVLWDKGRMHHFWNPKLVYQQAAEPFYHAVIINPVFLGALPKEVVSVLSTVRAEQPLFFNPDSQGLKEGLRKHLPERNLRLRQLPLLAQIGRRICKTMKIEPRIHPNFINMVFIEDQEENIKNLPHHWQQHFGWSLMAKLGAFKNIIIPYRSINGRFSYDLILNSLEGGHPLLTLQELPRRLMAFGSAKEMGDWQPLADVEIPTEVWRRLPEIKGLTDFSRFCGDKNLLSPPVVIRKLVRSRLLGRLEERLVGNSRYAEGAFVTFVPYWESYLNNALDLPWTGFHLSTISGKFGALKTNLGESDFAPIGAFFEGGVVGVIPVEKIKPRGPSVESYELIDSQNELVKDSPGRFLYRLKKVPEGYLFSSEGEFLVPPWQAIFHFHRIFEIHAKDMILRVPVTRKEFPPFPCGSDRTHALTQDALRKALVMWEQGGRQAIGALLELFNHGSHFLSFWTVNQQGIISENPAESFMKAIKKGWLVPITKVSQG